MYTDLMPLIYQSTALCVCTITPHAAYNDSVQCTSHRSYMYSFMYAQEKLVYKSKYCPKRDCGAPMAKYIHLGVKKMRCTKKKCNHITRELVLVCTSTNRVHLAPPAI